MTNDSRWIGAAVRPVARGKGGLGPFSIP